MPKGSRIPDKERDAVVADYAVTGSSVVTANTFKLSQSTVYKIVSSQPGFQRKRFPAGPRLVSRRSKIKLAIVPREPRAAPKYEQSTFIAPPSLSRLMGQR